MDDRDPDERFSIEVDSEELPPESERCSPCGGVGWRYEAAVLTVPPQVPDWQACKACDRTGREASTLNTRRRPKPPTSQP